MTASVPLVFVLCLLLNPLTVNAQEPKPPTIKGVYLGQSVQDYLTNSRGKARFAKFDIRDCSTATTAPLLDNSGRPIGPTDKQLCEQFALAAAGGKQTIRLSNTMPGDTVFERGVVTEHTDIILPEFSQPLVSQWDKVLFDLKQKIGDPQDTSPVVAQNGFGAKFIFKSACWTLSGPSYVCAREDRWNSMNVVQVRMSSKTPGDRQQELANKPSVLD